MTNTVKLIREKVDTAFVVINGQKFKLPDWCDRVRVLKDNNVQGFTPAGSAGTSIGVLDNGFNEEIIKVRSIRNE